MPRDRAKWERTYLLGILKVLGLILSPKNKYIQLVALVSSLADAQPG